MKHSILACIALFVSHSGYAEPLPDARAISPRQELDLPALVRRANLNYSTPTQRWEDGMPLGTGRMGTMVWTTPRALRMQINRVDVFGMDGRTRSFVKGNTSYGQGCAFVDIHVEDYGPDVFSGEHFAQHLDVYDGRMTVRGNGVEAELFAWMEHDLIAIRITDTREEPAPISIDLRMLRYAMQIMGRNVADTAQHINRVQTASHFAASRLHPDPGKISLSQEFYENAYYNASAVTARIVGRPSRTQVLNQTTVRLTAEPGRGHFVVLLASASSFRRGERIIQKVDAALAPAEAMALDTLRDLNRDWWHRFWKRSFVQLSSPDGKANLIEQHYTWFKYLMASCSQGDYQPRFGGMLWSGTADAKNWGAQYWVANQRCFYLPLPPTGHFELMAPLYDQYSRHYEAYAAAARQQWGSQGLWIPETTWFNGPAALPDDIAAEMQELYLLRKPWHERSQRFQQYARTGNVFDSRWNWGGKSYWGPHGELVRPRNPHAPFAHVSHIMSGTPQIAWYFWLKYEYTMDQTWLAERAYPMLRGAIEFYRHFPNLKRDKDGVAHIHHVNNNEQIWNTTDALWDLSAIHGLTPILLRASEILDRDADLRPAWRELLAHIAPMPTTAELGEAYRDQPERWIASRPPAAAGNPAAPARTCFLDFYDLATAATEDARIMALSDASFDALYPRGISARTPVVELDRTPITAARLGRHEAAAHMVYNQLTCANIHARKFEVFRNRMTAKPGFGAIGAQRIGNASAAVNEMLLQSAPPAPGGDPVIHVFPACPPDWSASFTLLARGAFRVASTMEQGTIPFVEITSPVGGPCRVQNPWPGKPVRLHRNGTPAEPLHGTVLTFATRAGERVALRPQD